MDLGTTIWFLGAIACLIVGIVDWIRKRKSRKSYIVVVRPTIHGKFKILEGALRVGRDYVDSLDEIDFPVVDEYGYTLKL